MLSLDLDKQRAGDVLRTSRSPLFLVDRISCISLSPFSSLSEVLRECLDGAVRQAGYVFRDRFRDKVFDIAR